MQLSHVLVLLVAFLLVSRFEATFNVTRLRELKKMIRDTELATMPGGDAAIAAAVREVRRVDRCEPNICFVLDGNRQIGKKDFELQKQFVQIVTAIVGADDNAYFGGVQYGRGNMGRVVRKIRGNPKRFLLDVERTRWKKSKTIFIDAGLRWCLNTPPLSVQPRKIVLFGDSRSSYGPLDGPLGALAITAELRSRSPLTSICAVAVGFSGTDPFTDIIHTKGDPSLALKVTGWFRVLEILPALVREICANNDFRR